MESQESSSLRRAIKFDRSRFYAFTCKTLLSIEYLCRGSSSLRALLNMNKFLFLTIGCCISKPKHWADIVDSFESGRIKWNKLERREDNSVKVEREKDVRDRLRGDRNGKATRIGTLTM